jgi:fructose-bisphosphate aldolase, class I
MANIKPRQNRLFASSGKCFDVAIDHGFFNEVSFLSGIESMPKAIETIVAAGPDAIQLTIGQAEVLQKIPGKQKPSLVLRTDVANVYGSKLPRVLFSKIVDDAVEQAVRLDAACVVVNLLMLPDQPELHGQCIDNICKLKPQCDKYGMPLMIEPLVMQPNDQKGGYMVDGDINKILPLVRQARELGADIIKADTAGVPVLPRGGGRAPDREIFTRTIELIKQGASGIVYGRNVIQHPNPKGMTEAFMAIVHKGASVEEALKIVEKK